MTSQPIPARAAVDVLRELHHVVVWTAFRYSTNPEAVPTGASFDPALAQRMAPLSRDEVVRLAERFRQQDEAHARELRERDDLAAAKDAEIAQLREQIKAAQDANTQPDTHDYSEARTRELIIDELLHEAGWSLTDERDREFEVTGMPNEHGRRIRRLRAVGSGRSAAGGDRGEEVHGRAGDRAAAGQAVRRLPGADDGPPPGDLLLQRLPHLAVGRRRRLPTARGGGLLDPRRARADDRAAHHPPAAGRRGDQQGRSRAALPAPRHPAPSTRRSPTSSAESCW